MTRTEYDVFHRASAKRIEADISFFPRPQHPSTLMAGPLPIQNAVDVDAFLEIHYHPKVGSKVFTIVSRSAGGPICRLCVDGVEHKPHGRSHKHRLGSPVCPRENLKSHIETREDLSGKDISELFRIFCTLANITHAGQFTPPNEQA